MKKSIILILALLVTITLVFSGCGEKQVHEMSYSKPEPDYEYQLFWSDDVVLGEVIEELEGFYSNPDGKITECANAWVTPYVLKVEKSYKGLFREGDTVILNTWNGSCLTPEEYESLDERDRKGEFYLHEGQCGVFVIEETLYITSADGETMYNMVQGEESVFEPKEKGTALMNEEAKQVYASPSLEMTLDRLPDDIKTVEDKYKDIDKTRSSDDI